MLFWHSLDSHHYKVIQHPLLSVALYRADVAVYDAILTYLNNHAFLPMEPHIRSALRRLGLNLEHCAALALQSFPQHVKGCRIELASRTAHLLSRHVDIVEHVSLDIFPDASPVMNAMMLMSILSHSHIHYPPSSLSVALRVIYYQHGH